MRRVNVSRAVKWTMVLAVGAALGCEQSSEQPSTPATQPQQTQSPAGQGDVMGQSRGGALGSAQDAAENTMSDLENRQQEIDDYIDNEMPPE
jgi:hypothetical protein